MENSITLNSDIYDYNKAHDIFELFCIILMLVSVIMGWIKRNLHMLSNKAAIKIIINSNRRQSL